MIRVLLEWHLVVVIIYAQHNPDYDYLLMMTLLQRMDFLISKDFAISLDPGGDKKKLPHILMYVWKIGIQAPDKYSVIIVRSPIKVNIIVNLADEAIEVR